jgi:glycosyltransferase involved in cell wall biosynthesis
MAGGVLQAKTSIIPHGLNPRFNQTPKVQRARSDYDEVNPYRVLYVSIIDQYKHQWFVVEAVATLRDEGFPIVLDLVGPAYPAALKRLNQTINCVDAERRWVHYHGAIPFNELHLCYSQADLGLFASSCENMPNILLETMASGLPIACSNRGPMPEVLGNWQRRVISVRSSIRGNVALTRRLSFWLPLRIKLNGTSDVLQQNITNYRWYRFFR